MEETFLPKKEVTPPTVRDSVLQARASKGILLICTFLCLRQDSSLAPEIVQNNKGKSGD